VQSHVTRRRVTLLGEECRSAAPARWVVPPAAASKSCSETEAERSLELERLGRELAAHKPYDEQYRLGGRDPAAQRWFDERIIAARLANPPAGMSISSDCRGSVCRLDVVVPRETRGPYDRWLATSLERFDVRMVHPDGQPPVRYVRVPQDEAVDGMRTLARFEEGYSWEGLRALCEGEGALEVFPLRVEIAIKQNADGDEPQ
jgi:hypothetical protein